MELVVQPAYLGNRWAYIFYEGDYHSLEKEFRYIIYICFLLAVGSIGTSLGCCG